MINVQSLPHFQSAYPEIFSEERLFTDTKCHFSQSGEDLVAEVFLQLVEPRPEKGLIVDFGAYHPYKYSNTFLFYLQGWRGINVDANSQAIAEFNRLRPQDLNIHSLMSDKTEDVDYYKFPEGGYNTVLKSSADVLIARGKTDPATQTFEVERLRSVTPNEILSKYARGVPIDFMSIDLEGMDAPVLRSIDFDSFRPRIIAVELPLHEIQSAPLSDILREVGYSLYSMCIHTAILVDDRNRR